MPIRVLITDDHSVIRRGLRALLKADPEVAVVGEAGDGGEAYRMAEDLAPDVVLLDIGMPGEDGIQTAKRLRSRFPDLRILFLTMHEDEGLLREAIQSGAAGYVVKRAEESEIINAIHAAHRGDLYVHPAMTRALVQARAAGPVPPSGGGVPLTKREVDILKLLAKGYTNREIGETLGLSVRTVEGYRANVLGKLGVSSRVELVAFAEEHGLI